MHRNLLERGTNLQQFRKASFLCLARGRLSNFSSTVQNLCKKRKFVFGRLLILAAPGLKFHGSEILFIYFFYSFSCLVGILERSSESKPRRNFFYLTMNTVLSSFEIRKVAAMIILFQVSLAATK